MPDDLTAGPFTNQDRAAGEPLAAFAGDGRLVEQVGYGLDEAYARRDELAARDGVEPSAYEVLAVCVDHPTTSAVDCMRCQP